MKIQTNKSIRNFLLAVRHIDSFFSEFLLIQMRKTTLNIFEIVENFRHNVRMLKNAKSAFFSHFAFAIYDSGDFSKESNKDSNKNSKKESFNKKSFFRRKSMEAFEGIYDKKNWYFKCFYLNKKIRFSKWKAGSKI